MSERGRTWLLAAVGAALAGSVAWPALRGLGSVDAVGVPLFEVERGPFVREVVAEGNLKAVEATLLGPPPEVRQSLKIAWLAPDGSRVEADQVVIRFDPSEMEEDLRDGRYDRAAVDSKIASKEALDVGNRNNLRRDADMATLELDYAEGFQTKDARIFSRTEILESEIDQQLARTKVEHATEADGVQAELSEAELDLLGIERRKAEIKIEQAQKGLERLEVRAPHPGIFVLKPRWGRLPEVGQTVWGGNPIAEIPKLDAMEADVFVLEADAGGLEAGLSATVVIEAHPDRVWNATVGSVDALAQRRNRRVPVQYFRVTLELERTDPEVMKPGQRVRSTLTLERRDDAIAIPRQAVFEEEDSKIVYRREGGEFRPVEVELGEAALGRVVIVAGLEPGDRIALRDPTRPVEVGPGQAPGGTVAPMGTES